MIDILLDSNQAYAKLIGQNLNLCDSGSAIFTGLNPQLWMGPGFTGNLASNTFSVLPSPPPGMSCLSITNGSFQATLSHMPTTGAVSIGLSTDLISWLQVGFYPASGTNLTFSLPVSNNPAAFFRAGVVP